MILTDLQEIFKIPDPVCPDSLGLEQASGREAADYVASLIPKNSVVADITAGLGINTCFFNRRARQVFSVEIDSQRSMALGHNLRNSNVEVINEDCQEWLDSFEGHLDIVYADPARRNKLNRKLVLIEDCSPNILELMPVLKEKADRLLIKTSPLLDMKEVSRLIPEVEGFHVIEVNREVKELLIDVNLKQVGQTVPYVKCVIIDKENSRRIIDVQPANGGQSENFTGKIELRAEVLYSGGYIYEPSPALMKAGNFDVLYLYCPAIQKFAQNTHLFFSKEFYQNFPGRIFQIRSRMTAGDLKKIKGACFNVISRNHPARAPELETRYKLKSSDTDFLIACSTRDEKIILNVVKI